MISCHIEKWESGELLNVKKYSFLFALLLVNLQRVTYSNDNKSATIVSESKRHPKQKEMILSPILARTAMEQKKPLTQDVAVMEIFKMRHAIASMAKVQSNAPPVKVGKL